MLLGIYTPCARVLFSCLDVCSHFSPVVAWSCCQPGWPIERWKCQLRSLASNLHFQHEFSFKLTFLTRIQPWLTISTWIPPQIDIFNINFASNWHFNTNSALNWHFQHEFTLNPLLPSAAYMRCSAKILILILERVIKKKKFCERCDYELVDEKSLS